MFVLYMNFPILLLFSLHCLHIMRPVFGIAGSSSKKKSGIAYGISCTVLQVVIGSWVRFFVWLYVSWVDRVSRVCVSFEFAGQR